MLLRKLHSPKKIKFPTQKFFWKPYIELVPDAFKTKSSFVYSWFSDKNLVVFTCSLIWPFNYSYFYYIVCASWRYVLVLIPKRFWTNWYCRYNVTQRLIRTFSYKRQTSRAMTFRCTREKYYTWNYLLDSTPSAVFWRATKHATNAPPERMYEMNV